MQLLSGIEEERFTKATIQSFSRSEASRRTVPITSTHITPSDGEAIFSLSNKRVTDVFELNEIPSLSVLTKWRNDIAETLRKLPGGALVYIEADGHTYDMEALCHMSLLHTAQRVKAEAQVIMSWALSIAHPPIRLQKELVDADELMKIQDAFLNPRWNEVLTEYDMDSGELLQIGAEGQLSGDHMRWFASKLNDIQTDVLCIYPSTASRDGNAGENKSTKPDDTTVPRAFLLLLNVGCLNGKVFIGDEKNPGNHFSVCYADKSLGRIIYGDSLGWPPPDDLEEVVSAHSADIWGSSWNIGNTFLCHDPSSLSPNGIHICTGKCASHYPLQKDGNICGVVVLLVSAIACLHPTFFHYLTSVQDDANYRGSSHLRNPSSFGQYLRKVLAWWFITKQIDIDYMIPIEFDRYIFIRNKWKTCGPDVHDLRIDPDTHWSLIDVMIQGPGSLEKKLIDFNDRLIGTKKLGDIIEKGDGINAALLQTSPTVLNEDRLDSIKRIETMNLQLPHITVDHHASFATSDDNLPIVDVLQLPSIPDSTTVLAWKDQLTQAERETNQQVYMETDSARYDIDALEKLLQLYNLIDIRTDVSQELIWFLTLHGSNSRVSELLQLPNFTGDARVPLVMQILENIEKEPCLPEVTASPNIESVESFLGYTFFVSAVNKRDETYGMDVCDLSRIFCDRWITAAHIRWILSHLNAVQLDTVCIYHCDVKDIKAFADDHWHRVLRIPNGMVLVFEVSRCEDQAVLREDTELGNHVMLCYVDVVAEQITVGDSLGWTAPVNLRETVTEYCNEVLKVDSATFQWVTAHPSSSMVEEHICTSSCASYYPFQDCGSIAGVIVAVIAVLACLKPEVFRFITTIKETNRYPEADFLRRPTQSAKYLRRVLAAWFGKETICADHVVPRGFDNSWLLVPTEDSPDYFMEYIGPNNYPIPAAVAKNKPPRTGYMEITQPDGSQRIRMKTSIITKLPTILPQLSAFHNQNKSRCMLAIKPSAGPNSISLEVLIALLLSRKWERFNTLYFVGQSECSDMIAMYSHSGDEAIEQQIQTMQTVLDPDAYHVYIVSDGTLANVDPTAEEPIRISVDCNVEEELSTVLSGMDQDPGALSLTYHNNEVVGLRTGYLAII